MIDYILSLVAPHYCCGCDEIGSLLCDNCKYNIKFESKMVCISCHKPTGKMWLCKDCHVPYERAWVVSEREGALQRLVGLYKFGRAKASYKVLGNLLLETLPCFPPDTVVVPVPTVSSHIRERGYDHMLLIARYVAQSRGLKCEQLLFRRTDTKQRQATVSQRVVQAKCAFEARNKIDGSRPYLLIDDVVTTGSTIKYTSKALRDAGAERVWVAVIARQIKK